MLQMTSSQELQLGVRVKTHIYTWFILISNIGSLLYKRVWDSTGSKIRASISLPCSIKYLLGSETNLMLYINLCLKMKKIKIIRILTELSNKKDTQSFENKLKNAFLLQRITFSYPKFQIFSRTYLNFKHVNILLASKALAFQKRTNWRKNHHKI